MQNAPASASTTKKKPVIPNASATEAFFVFRKGKEEAKVAGEGSPAPNYL